MKMHRMIFSPRVGRLVLSVALLVAAVPARAQEPPGQPLIVAAAEPDTNAVPPAKKSSTRAATEPAAPATRQKARFMGAFGLVVIALLVLITGIALLRSFREH